MLLDRRFRQQQRVEERADPGDQVRVRGTEDGLAENAGVVAGQRNDRDALRGDVPRAPIQPREADLEGVGQFERREAQPICCDDDLGEARALGAAPQP